MTTEMDLQQDEMREIIDDFLIEAEELIDALDSNFVKLETTPEDLDLLNEIFRGAHTIKGTSSFLGFDQVTNLTHKMEDILNKLRKAEMKVSSEIMDVLLAALDQLKVLLDMVKNGDSSELDLSSIMSRLEKILSESSDQSDADNSGSTPSVEDNGETKDTTVVKAEPAPETKGTTSTGPSTSKKSSDQTIRVDVARLDGLLNMMGELVLGRNSLMQSLGQLNDEYEGDHRLESINHASNAVNFITTELQMAVMKMRMQPIGKVFNKFPRLVRDLARDSGKQIELVISGETTELDKTVIEEIGDPLVHIIRNSCDHGIESPEVRKKAGKPEKGTVHLDACQEGSNIVIKISDDGKGFDVEAIKDKAVDRGIVSRADVEKMSDKEIFRFIFHAGFSTAKVITDVSGRGVGMDVVRSNIEKLNGMVELDGRKGEGSSVIIKLPLTLAIIQGLLVECDDEVFVLPLSSVSETVKTEQTEVFYINQRPVIRIRDDIIPVVNLSRILNADRAGFVMAEKPYIVIICLAEKKLGLIVDRFLGQEEVVIKSLGEYLGGAEGIAGATIMGDGRIRLIVDLIGLFKIASKLG